MEIIASAYSSYPRVSTLGGSRGTPAHLAGVGSFGVGGGSGRSRRKQPVKEANTRNSAWPRHHSALLTRSSRLRHLDSVGGQFQNLPPAHCQLAISSPRPVGHEIAWASFDSITPEFTHRAANKTRWIPDARTDASAMNLFYRRSGHSVEKKRSGVDVVTWRAVAPCVRPLSEWPAAQRR